MFNGSLKYCFYDVFEKELLDWKIWFKIVIGVLWGFVWFYYSCNLCIIYCNISFNCIFFDEEFEFWIIDFGLVCFMNLVDIYISIVVNGDFGDVGYVVLEYVCIFVVIMWGDVYSFGVVFLEFVIVWKFVDVVDSDFKGILVEWVGMLVFSGCIVNVLDLFLWGRGVDDEML